MSDKRRLLNTIVILLFVAAAITFRIHLNEFSRELTNITAPFMSPLLMISIFIAFLGYLIVKNRNKIRDLDNLNTKDMIYMALLLIGSGVMILLIIYGLIKGTI